MTIDVGNGLRLEVRPSGAQFIAPYVGNLYKEPAFDTWVRWCGFSGEATGMTFMFTTEQDAIDAIEAFREMEMKR